MSTVVSVWSRRCYNRVGVFVCLFGAQQQQQPATLHGHCHLDAALEHMHGGCGRPPSVYVLPGSTRLLLSTLVLLKGLFCVSWADVRCPPIAQLATGVASVSTTECLRVVWCGVGTTALLAYACASMMMVAVALVCGLGARCGPCGVVVSVYMSRGGGGQPQGRA